MQGKIVYSQAWDFSRETVEEYDKKHWSKKQPKDTAAESYSFRTGESFSRTAFE